MRVTSGAVVAVQVLPAHCCQPDIRVAVMLVLDTVQHCQCSSYRAMAGLAGCLGLQCIFWKQDLTSAAFAVGSNTMTPARNTSTAVVRAGSGVDQSRRLAAAVDYRSTMYGKKCKLDAVSASVRLCGVL
jgi:hypothetical protein